MCLCVACLFRGALGQSSSGYWTGAYGSASAGDCAHPDGCEGWVEVGFSPFPFSGLWGLICGRWGLDAPLNPLGNVVRLFVVPKADVGWDRTDKEQSFEDKVNKVRQLLGKE